MMIARDQADDATKQEGNTGGDDQKTTNSKASSSSAAAAAASWSRLKDPRIVRVSRAFGGKDRHSKVCTVRGLRDRRVRLSVPTAIQLYDLQDRLGLNQPSKVVDWLLDAAKNEIDELPPLQMPPGSLISHNFQSLLNPHHQSSNKEPRIGSSGINGTDPPEPKGSNNTWNSRSKETARESNEEGKHDQSNFEDHHNNFFSSRPHGNIGLLNNNLSAQPYSSLIRWDPSTLSLSQSGLTPNHNHHHQQQQQEDNFQNFNVVPLASSGGPPQVLVYQPPGITQSYFPSPINFQMLNSNSDNPLSNSPLDSASSQQGRPYHFHMSTTTTNFLPTVPEDRGNELTNNEGEFRSR